jgi:hypothetical protein
MRSTHARLQAASRKVGLWDMTDSVPNLVPGCKQDPPSRPGFSGAQSYAAVSPAAAAEAAAADERSAVRQRPGLCPVARLKAALKAVSDR